MRKEQSIYKKTPLLPKKKNLDFFHVLPVAQKKKPNKPQNLELLFSPFPQVALPNVLAKVILLVWIQLLINWGL